MSEERIRRLQEFATFEPGTVYVLIALARKKENESISRNTRYLFRETAQNEGQIAEAIDTLRGRVDQYDYTFRLYMSINRRDVLTASFMLRKRLNSWTQGLLAGDDEMIEHFERTGSEFRSCLQLSECKDEKHFLIDIDEPGEGDVDELRTTLSSLTMIRLDQSTPNGHHLVVDGFNPTGLFERTDVDYELKKDANLFVCYL